MAITLISLFLIIYGLGCCWFGYSRWKGKMHWSFYDHGFFQEANYLAIPLGIASIIMGIAILPLIPAQIQLSLIYLAGLVMILGFIFSWRLFKPKWVRWIEENHKDVIPHLMVEVRDYGWQAKTQKELEEWIVEIRRRYRVNKK